MNLNHFTKQGKALHCEVCEMIVEKWLEGSSDFVTNSIWWVLGLLLWIVKSSGLSTCITSESQLKNRESLIENAWYGPFNQTVNLETDAKTFYDSLLKWKYSPIYLKHKKTKIIIYIFKQQLQKSHKQDILPTNLQIDRSSFASYGMHAMNYFASLDNFLCEGHKMQR